MRRQGDKIDYYQIQLTPAVTLVDASVQANYKDWAVGLNVTNLADKEYLATCSRWSATFPDGMCYVGMTRTIIGTVSKKF